MNPSPSAPPSFHRLRWWRSPFLLLALLGGISLGWIWWESSQQGRGIGWNSSTGRRYFVSHGAGWLYLGAVNPQRGIVHTTRGLEPWKWDPKMKGEHQRWLPPMAVKTTDENELRRLGFCYWFLLSNYLGFCLGLGIWWQRRRVAACQMALPDETSELS